jgi:3-methyladenine DNA glycosylase AlkC
MSSQKSLMSTARMSGAWSAARNLTLKNIAAFSQALGLPASKLLAKAEALIDKR